MRAVRCSTVVAVAMAMLLIAFGGLAAAAAPKKTGKAGFKARGSVSEAYVLGAKQGNKLLLVNRKNKIVRFGRADRFGSKIFYDIPAGKGYTVRFKTGRKIKVKYKIRIKRGKKKGKKVTKFKKVNQVKGTRRFTVLRMGDNPKNSFYKGIKLKQGLNYVKMRDGVELAMTVRLPSGATLADGPFPTFVEYSGYQTAAPHDLLESFLTGTPDPLAPATSTAIGSLIGPLLDFATVSVQMRGSGCSGGGFDLFGLPTTYDGYDAVETVGNQSWVKGGKVGMAGISFSGITQLFTAGTQPPHLAAISPMSVTDDTYSATGYPGGIFNKGFAFSWILARMDDAKPAPEGGQAWAKALTTAGDRHCIANQKLRLQTRNAPDLVKDNPYRTPKLFKYRAPSYWVKHIKVPVFWVGQFQDEQTGGHFPESIANLKNNPNVWVSMQNGVHADSLGPSTITRWVEFMKLFVADEIPDVPAPILSLSSLLYNELADAPALPVQQSRFAAYTSVDQARNEFKQDPRIRLLFDNGAAIPGSPGAIGAAWDLGFSSWPISEAQATSYYLDGSGGLNTSKPATQAPAQYTADPGARPPQTLIGAGEADAWKAQPPYNWAPVAAGKGLGFTSSALGSDTLVAGPSSLDLYLKSSAADTDLQVTLSEVRPDGKETYVQNGWLRASHRKLDPALSTDIDPVPTHLKEDAAPLPAGEFSLVRVPIFPVAHEFRAGSKIRVVVQAVSGDRPIWDFDTVDNGTTVNTVALGGAEASRLVLPIVSGTTAGAPLPTATALRGEPSRTYATASNGG